MGKFKQRAIGIGLKAVANNKTANDFANQKLKKYADKSDNKVLKFIADNQTANNIANKTLKIVANNKTLNNLASDIINKKL